MGASSVARLLFASAFVANALLPAAAQEPVRVEAEFLVDTDSGIIRTDGKTVHRAGPAGWFELPGLEIPEHVQIRVQGQSPFQLRIQGNARIDAAIDLSGADAGRAEEGGGGGGALAIWCTGNLTLGPVDCSGGDGGSDGGGGGGGFVEILVDGQVDLLGKIDVSPGAGGKNGDDGEGGVILVGGGRGIGALAWLHGFRRVLLRVPEADVSTWDERVTRAAREGRCSLWAIHTVEFLAAERPRARFLADLRRSAKGGSRASDARPVPDLSWIYSGTGDSIVECDRLSDFQLESQNELRDCFPVSLQMTLNHLARLQKARGGTVSSLATYEDVRWLTHESDMARDHNGEGGMVHSAVALWAANVMADRMGLVWRFEAQTAGSPEELADALRWGLPLIITTTKRVMSDRVVRVVNPVVAASNLPGRFVSGTGSFIERKTGPLGFLGKPFQWAGDFLQPGKHAVAEDNVFTHYLHASVLVRVDLDRETYRLADPWAGINSSGAAGFLDVSSRYLWKNFINYQTSGIGSGNLIDEWIRLAAPGSYLIPVPR